MKRHNLQIETANQIGQPLSVISVLTGTYRAVSILTLLKARLQYLLSPVDLAVSIRVAVPCKMISKVESIIASA